MHIETMFDIVRATKYPRGVFKVDWIDDPCMRRERILITFRLRSRDVCDRKKWTVLTKSKMLHELDVKDMRVETLQVLIKHLVLNVVEHEMMEWLTIGGVNIFNPHKEKTNAS